MLRSEVFPRQFCNVVTAADQNLFLKNAMVTSGPDRSQDQRLWIEIWREMTSVSEQQN